MHILLSKKGIYKDSFFWGCSSYPTCRNLVNTTMKNEKWQNVTSNFCSDPFCISNPRITDWQRHSSINSHYNWDHIFLKSDIEKLTVNLGFNSINEFIYWIHAQNQIEVSHNTFPVPSPYIGTFRNLITSVKEHFSQIVQTLTHDLENIENSIIEWTEYFRSENERMRPIYERKEKALTIELAIQERNKRNRENRLIEIQNFRKLSYTEVENIQNKLRKQHMNSSIEKRLKTIVDDLKYPPEYYPIDWFKLSDVEINRCDLELIQKLIDKLHVKVRGERKKFKTKLIKAVNKQS
jgi:hypothetical protein